MNKQELIQKYEKQIAPYCNDAMKGDLENTENVLELLDVFLEYLPSVILHEIVSHEITSGDADFRVKLELLKKIIESDNSFHFTVPTMEPLPAQMKMTQAEAEGLVGKIADESEKAEDLVKILLLTNFFEVGNEEKDLIKRIKGKSNTATWFSFTGANVWPSAKVLTTLAPDPYLFVNLSLRMSYHDKGEEMNVRLLGFDNFKNYEKITDFRHLEAIVARQKLIPGIISKDYIAGSYSWYLYNCTVNPDAVWPFFAENMAYIDKGLCIYNPVKPNAKIYTDYAIRILSYFPSLSERYYNIVLAGALFWPDKIAHECFMLLKKHGPDFEKTLEDYAKSESKVIAERAEIWLKELRENPQPSPKRYFISKKGDQFWNIYQMNSVYVTEYGAIDSTYPGSNSEYTLSVGEAKQAIEDEVNKQKQNGYTETDENGVANAIKKRKEKALKTVIKKLKEGRTLIAPPLPSNITLDINQTIANESGKHYTCATAAGILTDLTDINHIKATIQYLIGYITETKFTPGEDFITIGTMLKNEFTPLEFEKAEYSISFDVFCTEAYKHPELHDWLAVLLKTISKTHNVDEPIWADPQTVLGITLAFLLARERKYAQLFMDYFHSIQPADNHTYYAYEVTEDLPIETRIQLLAGFYANSVCCGDLEDEAFLLVEKFTKEEELMLIAYLEIETKYLLKEVKRHASSIASSLENYFYDFYKEKNYDPELTAKLFVEYIESY